jgi:hypothetical protein
MATLSATLAAIANVTTLAPVPAAKPVPPVVWVKQAGPRRFHAACKVQDEWCKVTAGGRPAAVKALRGELSRRGTPLPAEVTVKEVAPETATTPAGGPTLVIPPVTPAPGPVLVTPTTPSVPGGGRVTPLIDREGYSKAAAAAIALAASLDLPADPREAIEKFRQIVNETCRAANFVGPYDRLPNGEMWLRLCPGVYDPTSRAPRAGDGARRIGKDLNGNPVDSQGEAVLLKPRRGEEPKYQYPGPKEVKSAAWAQAAKWSAVCREAGMDRAACTIAYKLGFIATTRAAKAVPHEKFETDLAVPGLDETLAAIVAAVNAKL